MVVISDRLHIKKESEDNCIIKLFIYNYIIQPNDKVILKIYENTEENTIKEIEMLTYDKEGAFFNLENNIPIGNYFYEVIIKNEFEEVVIIQERRFTVC